MKKKKKKKIDHGEKSEQGEGNFKKKNQYRKKELLFFLKTITKQDVPQTPKC